MDSLRQELFSCPGFAENEHSSVGGRSLLRLQQNLFESLALPDDLTETVFRSDFFPNGRVLKGQTKTLFAILQSHPGALSLTRPEMDRLICHKLIVYESLVRLQKISKYRDGSLAPSAGHYLAPDHPLHSLCRFLQLSQEKVPSFYPLQYLRIEIRVSVSPAL
jgi:hypothetical protein